MDRRSFLKGAAAAAAVVPIAAAAAPAPALETAGLSAINAEFGTVTGAEIASGSITAAKIDLRNAFVIYQNGMCKFGPAGEPRVMVGIWADPPGRMPTSLPDFGEPRVIIRRTDGAEIENRFEVIE